MCFHIWLNYIIYRSIGSESRNGTLFFIMQDFRSHCICAWSRRKNSQSWAFETGPSFDESLFAVRMDPCLLFSILHILPGVHHVQDHPPQSRLVLVLRTCEDLKEDHPEWLLMIPPAGRYDNMMTTCSCSGSNSKGTDLERPSSAESGDKNWAFGSLDTIGYHWILHHFFLHLRWNPPSVAHEARLRAATVGRSAMLPCSSFQCPC